MLTERARVVRERRSAARCIGMAVSKERKETPLRVHRNQNTHMLRVGTLTSCSCCGEEWRGSSNSQTQNYHRSRWFS